MSEEGSLRVPKPAAHMQLGNAKKNYLSLNSCQPLKGKQGGGSRGKPMLDLHNLVKQLIPVTSFSVSF